ncbi:hypothetical protein A2634_00260 [Candidatus Amesbacteria bacterium RIFCSPHIGHO2_01_FULL_48_32]|uniref:HD domain-containing protein n=1 Tax=Candidatus Amesbacteria bacterium RIFCSPLOWO2_01_FULL_48_25 TaxID=1797259 RepID=A0A1F4ZAR6_9BACT|nr:MAG: hypothetical protein A2634_00260 [Candidatus Amesbacteria bacterium RIFCSPHIGHO2_01_FULL_48_32]OGD03241.1 MAG: hypothetical protein A2989_00210 [Candidatus Amesbacteria bacterium RIFCSPLOWO2_01_FULL_48_25]HJZ05186.1 HD domain-containing protein [Patescibacteria group bacterium]
MTLQLTVPEQVWEILNKFEGAEYEIYIVGGVIRDILLNKSLYDWDFTTNATPEEILKLFPDGFYDNKFGTVGIENPGERPYEITTFRTEAGYSDSRHPDKVVWGETLEEDLRRRDFTINAMALKVSQLHSFSVSQFELIDLYNGQEDLKNKLIRAVGNPNKRFSEDALRMMRAVRIAAQLQFSIEETTFQAIKASAGQIQHISWERIRDELLKIMASKFPADGYLILRNCGLGTQILPEVELAYGVEQKSPGRHHIYDVGTHSVESLRHCPSADPITRLATLVHDLGKVKTQKVYPDGRITFYNHEMESAKIAKKIAERLRFSNDQKDLFERLVRWHQFTVNEFQTDSAVRRFITNVGRENIDEMLALRTGDRLGSGAKLTSWRTEEFKKRIELVQQQPFSITDLKINGRDVMEIKKIPPGPQIGKYLQMLFEEVVEKRVENEREVLLKRLTEI